MTNRTIFIIISLFIVLILGLFLLLPKYQDIKSSQLDIKQKQEEIKQWEIYFSNIEKITKEMENYKEVIPKIDIALPSELSLPSLFYFIQKISSQTGLVLKEVGKVSDFFIEEKTDLKTYSFPIVLVGSYSSFKSFLQLLEKSSRFFEVESIAFSSAEGEPFLFNLRIKVYSY